MLIAAGVVGCDFGPGSTVAESGPALRIVASKPTKNTGLDCAPEAPACGFPLDAPFVFRFNRHLDPSTAVRQSLDVYAGTPDHGEFLTPSYDVIERAVSYSHIGTNLWPGAVYTVEVFGAQRDGEPGFRAYDGTPLAPADLPLEYSFRARAEPGPPAQGSIPADCRTALGILTSSCGVADCHASCSGSTCRRQPRMGLRLDSIEGLSDTAIDQLARETTRGQSATSPLQGAARFGVQMPIVDPARPDNSYLMYKLLVGRENYRANDGMACASRFFGDLPRSDCLAPSDDERERLRQWLVRGDPMPPAGYTLRGDSPIDAVRALQAWIQSGANTSDCAD
ncbi:MAG: hypothetical protein JW940_22245 [Polyangiaceae bacterium]|nr:hypothetical protein [Polyangiaceae bacterium]